MRLWLGAAFAGVALVTSASVYVFVDDSSGRTLQSQAADLAVGKTASLADNLAKVDKLHAANVLAQSNSETFEAWAINRHGNPFAPGQNLAALASIQEKPEAVRVALAGRRYRASLPGNVTLASAPIFGDQYVRGAAIVRAKPPPRSDPRLRPAARRPVAGVADLDRDRHPGRVPGLLPDRDPSEAPGAGGGGDGGGPLRRTAADRRRRRDRRPEPRPRLDARGASQDLQHARDRARPALRDLRRTDGGGDRGRRGRRGALHQPGRRQARRGRAARRRPGPVAAPCRRARRRRDPGAVRSTGASTACRRGGCRRSTPC